MVVTTNSRNKELFQYGGHNVDLQLSCESKIFCSLRIKTSQNLCSSYMFLTRIDKFELKYLSIILRCFSFYHDL